MKKRMDRNFSALLFLRDFVLGFSLSSESQGSKSPWDISSFSAKKTYDFPLLFMQILCQKAHLDRVRV